MVYTRGKEQQCFLASLCWGNCGVQEYCKAPEKTRDLRNCSLDVALAIAQASSSC